MRRSLGVVLGVGLLGAGLACGPSFQVIYEGNAHFEHCYALEENPQKQVPEKTDCWRDWSERYTYGQTRDRIHYATARYVALSQATNVPTDEAMMMAAPGMTPRQSAITAPAPTNAFAPPPKVLEDYPVRSTGRDPNAGGAPSGLPDAGATGAGGAGAGAGEPLPAATCSDDCGAKFRECDGGCGRRGSTDAGVKSPACAACEKTFKTCMRGCFK